MATILDGKTLAKKITEDLKEKVSKLSKKPNLVAILVGENPASKLYVGMKEKKAKEIGITSTTINLPENTTQQDLILKIEELNNNKEVDAILVQLPLPKHISETEVLQKIAPSKDVDGFTIENMGKITIGLAPNSYPCTPKGIIKLIENYGIEISGKNATIIGRSNIVGKPISLMLQKKNATITVCHSKTKDLKEKTLTADILISAVGSAHIIKKDMVKKGATVIDVGVSKIDGKIVGDIDFDNVSEIAEYITPNPGGVGPMTIAMLMENTYELAILHQNSK